MSQAFYEFDFGYEPIPNEMLLNAKWVWAGRNGPIKRLRNCRHNLPYLLWVDLMRLVLRDEAYADDLEGTIWRHTPPASFIVDDTIALA
jgi:hypothetical protein